MFGGNIPEHYLLFNWVKKNSEKKSLPKSFAESFACEKP